MLSVAKPKESCDYYISNSRSDYLYRFFTILTVERKPELTLVNVIQFNQLDFRGSYRIRTYDLHLVRVLL